jgi:L-alanine-DL-glutamate epimerase-like enolase superfamily enzyme
MHIATASPNFLIMEEGNKETKDYGDIFAGGWKQNLSEWTILEAPGLGVDFSPQFVKDRTVKI